MSAIERITKAAHLIDMKDIIREGNPTLRAVAEEVSFPLSDQDIILGEKMMQFLKHSQDPVMAEKLGLRGGVGLAAPQLDISKRIIAVLVQISLRMVKHLRKPMIYKLLCTILRLFHTQFKMLL